MGLLRRVANASCCCNKLSESIAFTAAFALDKLPLDAKELTLPFDTDGVFVDLLGLEGKFYNYSVILLQKTFYQQILSYKTQI